MSALVTPRTATRPEVAIVWIDRAHAHTIVIDASGRLIVDSAALPPDDESQGQVLLRMVEHIGAAPKVLLLGDSVLRTRLEREYVALGGHPDRLIETR
jgi:hypothetical protein